MLVKAKKNSIGVENTFEIRNSALATKFKLVSHFMMQKALLWLKAKFLRKETQQKSDSLNATLLALLFEARRMQEAVWFY